MHFSHDLQCDLSTYNKFIYNHLFFNFKGESLVFDKPLKNHTKIIVIKLAIY